MVGGAEGVLVDDEARRDADLGLQGQEIKELRARVVGERELGPAPPEGFLVLVATVPELVVTVSDPAAVQADADRVRAVGPVVQQELRL